jgi:hypothetical protein
VAAAATKGYLLAKSWPQNYPHLNIDEAAKAAFVYQPGGASAPNEFHDIKLGTEGAAGIMSTAH